MKINSLEVEIEEKIGKIKTKITSGDFLEEKNSR